jgi:rhodanese-related sulfurtransferase
MRRWMSSLTLNQKLAALAFALGALAIFARPTGGGAVTIDPNDLARIVQAEVDHVEPFELADWIMAGRADYRLVDLRDERAFAEYHIPGAQRLPITELPDAGLPHNEKIVLYSDGGIHSAQAWFLLKAKGYQGVYMLLGGLDAWRDEVLFPALAENPTPYQQQRNDKLTAIAQHFGGQPRSGAAAAEAAPQITAMPTLELPAGAAAPMGAPKKKKKEGC